MRILDFADFFSSASSPTVIDSAPVTQTLANNQAATNITSLSFDNTIYRGAVVEMDVSRKTASSERRGMKKLVFVYDTTALAWAVVDSEDNTGTDTGVTISMSGDQVQYATDNQAGASYAGSGKWNILRRYLV
jgi:hypothetical protein